MSASPVMENEGERKSMRSNLLEKRRLKLELASYDAAKRNVATDMRKAQTDMRRRLQRYKNRLKEISKDRDDSRIISIEQFLERHKRKKKVNVLSPRPHSSPLIRRMSKLIPPNTATDSPHDGLNPELFGGRRKSKVDLRPATACATASRLRTTDAFQRCGGSPICGDPEAQVRYFVEDELHDRASFYRYILGIRKDFQRQIADNLKYKVAEFCGKPTDCRLLTPGDRQDENETWRPMGMDTGGLQQPVKLFVPRMKQPLQTERSKTFFRVSDNASNKPLRIPSVVIHNPSDQTSPQKIMTTHGMRPSTAAVTRDVKVHQRNSRMPSEF